MKFKKLLIERFLTEISEGSVMYHRSTEELEPGQILDGTGHGVDSANDRKQEAENEFEEYRRNYASRNPSRKNAVFLSPTPKSRFNRMGDLYKVKITGNYHIADSRMFDAYMSPWDYPVESEEEAIRCYWEPKKSGCTDIRNVNPKYLEVVTDEAMVLKKEASDFLTQGDEIRIIESPPVPVQKGEDGTSRDPEVWRNHPGIENVWQDPDDENWEMAQPKEGSTWTVTYAKPQDTAQQQNRVRRGEMGMNYAKGTYKKIHLRDGKVAPAYGAYDGSIEQLKFEEI